MSTASLSLHLLAYSLALWLGLHLLGRGWKAPSLRRTGLGLVAYALALVGQMLAGSLVLVFGPWALFTTGGRWAVLAVADIVAAFAAVQTYGLWRRRGQPHPRS